MRNALSAPRWPEAGAASRVDTVGTHEAFRGRGFARAVIHELVAYHRRKIGGGLYLGAENPTAIRIYEEAGFGRIDADLACWSAWQDQVHGNVRSHRRPAKGLLWGS